MLSPLREKLQSSLSYKLLKELTFFWKKKGKENGTLAVSLFLSVKENDYGKEKGNESKAKKMESHSFLLFFSSHRTHSQQSQQHELVLKSRSNQSSAK
jgi:hypothetical protein